MACTLGAGIYRDDLHQGHASKLTRLLSFLQRKILERAPESVGPASVGGFNA